MADTEFNQERTEEPTVRRLLKAREQGNIPRSRELGALFILLGGGLALFFLVPYWVESFQKIFSVFLNLPRDLLFDSHLAGNLILKTLQQLSYLLMPFFLILIAMGILGQVLVGGWNFTFQSLAPSFEKLDPIQGIRRLFSKKSLMELMKSLLKFIVVSVCVFLILYWELPKFLALSQLAMQSAFMMGLRAVCLGFLLMGGALAIIAVLDVPFQLWYHKQSLRMTKQEVRDELKETEGRPEVKARVRRIQRERARSRMMQKIPQADVVVTNPDHYAVALKYDEKENMAPIVLAKGADLIAFKIMEVARHHKIPVLRVPPLTRSIYFTTDLDKQIPDGLYLAVAQILAYVYQLKQYQKGQAPAPGAVPKYAIPTDLRY